MGIPDCYNNRDDDGFEVGPGLQNTKFEVTKTYHGWESTQSFERDISELLENIIELHGNEFNGTIEIIFSYKQQ